MAEQKEMDMASADGKDHQDLRNRKRIIPYFRLFSYADTMDSILMLVGSIAAIANGISLPFMTVLMNDTINAFGRTTNADVINQVSKVSLNFVYLGLASCVASFIQVACWSITGERQATKIRILYVKAMLRQDITFFDKEVNSGEVVQKISSDTFLIQEAIGEKAGNLIQVASTFFGGFIIAFIQGWKLTLVMLSTIPPLALSAGLTVSLVAKMSANATRTYSDAANIAEQTISSIRTVASFSGEAQALNKYHIYLKRAYRSSILEALITGLGMGWVFCFIYFGYGLCIWFGSTLIVNKSYNGGDVINVMFAVVIGSTSMGQASQSTSAFAEGQAAAFELFERIGRKPDIDAYETTGKTLDAIQGDIELRDVWFSYPTRPDEQILRGMSLFIPSGATVALVGESGSGKSTVISLIQRFYDPQSGNILIDGIDLKEFLLRWIRGEIGLVSQEPVLFACSIRDNLAYGKNDATLEEIEAAIELANASKFIEKLPQGLDTMVGQLGTQLSGGQKQRVAIARAILKDPRILLLDEATSALDAESEQVVQQALERVMKNRTTIIVAHRLITVRSADMINVIHKGSVVEKGSHSELIEDPNGAYAQLIRLQQVDEGSGKHDTLIDQYSPALVDRDSSQRVSSRRTSSMSGISSPLSTDLANAENRSMSPAAEEPSKKHLDVPLRRLAYLNKPELPSILLGTVAALASGVTFPIAGMLLSNVIRTFYGPTLSVKKDSRFWSLMFVLTGLVISVSFPARAYFFSVAGSKLVRRIRLMSFDKVVHMEIEWFDYSENSSGAIGAKLLTDAATVRSLVGDALALLVQNLATLITGLLIAFAACWELALVILGLVPMMILNGWIQSKFLKGFNTQGKIYDQASQVAVDAIQNIRTVSSFTAEGKVLEHYTKKCEYPMKISIKESLVRGMNLGFSFFLLFNVYAITFYAGAWLVKERRTTFSEVFRAYFAISMAAVGISRTSTVAPDAVKAKSATASIFAILDRNSKIDSSDDSGITMEEVQGIIEFHNVNFRYPTRPDILVLRDLCLTIQSGKTVALVGESGSGKSTVISLLQRFYDPTSGQILLDGEEIQQLQLRWLRMQMGLVSQEPVLFNDTIRANIAYGKGGEATEAEILASSKSANADQFISGLQQGYDTLVGERGVQLSGGQKQRVAIARAIVKEPKILLLDEATSALDSEAERVVQNALEQVSKHRTTIIVAHRLSTIRGADLIAVLRNGVIIEQGNHESLISIKDGAYASLIALHSR